MQAINSPIPGYVHDPRPDRYPTRESWPAPGTRGAINGRPVTLLKIYFDFYAEFQSGPYSFLRADLQTFIPET